MGYRILAITLLSTLAISATALAAQALRGKTYSGAAASTGVNSEGQKQPLRVTGPIVLTVAPNGKTVTVRVPSPNPILYCRLEQQLRYQSTKPAKISASGSFRASISQRLAAGTGPAGIVQVVTGRFSGRKVTGTIHTEAGECGGVASFSATVS